MRTLSLPVTKKRWLDVAFWTAGANWEKWRHDFDYIGPPYNTTPVLNDPRRFLDFVSEYKLFQRQEIRARLKARTAILTANLLLAFGNPTGAGIDALAASLKSSGGTVKLEVSLLSKLAAFCEPTQFNAYDETARRGLRKWTPGFRKGSALEYEAFCMRINSALSGPLGREIGNYLKGQKTPPTSNIPGFTRRMLDVYLMIEGGRWISVIDNMRRRFQTAELSDEEVEQITSSRMDPRHDHLNALLDSDPK